VAAGSGPGANPCSQGPERTRDSPAMCFSLHSDDTVDRNAHKRREVIEGQMSPVRVFRIRIVFYRSMAACTT